MKRAWQAREEKRMSFGKQSGGVWRRGTSCPIQTPTLAEQLLQPYASTVFFSSCQLSQKNSMRFNFSPLERAGILGSFNAP